MWGQLHRICKKVCNFARKFDEMTRREINIVKREQKLTETFGRYNIFATLSLSLSLSQVLTASHTLLEVAGIRARIYGFPWNEPREARLFFIPIRL